MRSSGTTKSATRSGFTAKRIRPAGQTGSVLASVLVTLMILLAIFISAMTYALSRYGHHIARHNRVVAKHLAEAGIARGQLALESRGIAFDTSSWTSPIGGEVSTKTKPWGPYVLLESQGTYANQSVRAFAVLGSVAPSCMDGAVTVFDPGTPLVVAGHTRIVGDVYTGPMGIMEGHFRGEGAAFKDYLRGVNHSEGVVVQFEPDRLVLHTYLRDAWERRLRVTRQVDGSLLLDQNSENQFKEEYELRVRNDLLVSGATLECRNVVRTLFVDGVVDFRGSSIARGLLEIVSDEFIVVQDSTIIDRALLVAKDSIVIEGNAIFSGIAVCGGRIEVREGAQLVYPSGLFNEPLDGKTHDSAGIYLRSREWTESVVVVGRDNNPGSRPSRTIFVDTTTIARGFILSGDRADIRGAVFGSIAAEQFHFEYPPTTYINWLTDCYIDRSRLVYRPCLPILTPVDSVISLAVVSMSEDDL